jgi:ribosomal-protein-alanine N-acetyltransferase
MRVDKAAYPYPWTEAILRDCLRVGYYCWVLSAPNEIVGYGVMSVAAGECHILNLCVHPQAQGQGFGRWILRRLLAIARSRDADTAFLEVRTSNRSAHALYRLEGFWEVGTRRGYYPGEGGREDAVIMALNLG